jgi:RNA polymerase sigma-70 factor (ECF subfamily)
VSADDELVGRCLRGRPDAFRELVDRFQGEVYGLCARLLGHRQDAEDVTQEVFLRVARSLGRWDRSRPLRPWVMTIAVNRCRTWVGKRRTRPDTADFLHDLPARPDDSAPGELVEAVRGAVDALRDDYRLVFVLFHEHGQSYEEIATAVGRPVGTVKTWLHRARLQLLADLRDRGLVDEPEHQTGP